MSLQGDPSLFDPGVLDKPPFADHARAPNLSHQSRNGNQKHVTAVIPPIHDKPPHVDLAQSATIRKHRLKVDSAKGKANAKTGEIKIGGTAGNGGKMEAIAEEVEKGEAHEDEREMKRKEKGKQKERQRQNHSDDDGAMVVDSGRQGARGKEDADGGSAEGAGR